MLFQFYPFFFFHKLYYFWLEDSKNYHWIHKSLSYVRGIFVPLDVKEVYPNRLNLEFSFMRSALFQTSENTMLLGGFRRSPTATVLKENWFCH